MIRVKDKRLKFKHKDLNLILTKTSQGKEELSPRLQNSSAY